jgi:hypothetical protein
MRAVALYISPSINLLPRNRTTAVPNSPQHHYSNDINKGYSTWQKFKDSVAIREVKQRDGNRDQHATRIAIGFMAC